MTLFSKIREGIHSVWPISSPQRLAANADAESAALERFRASMLALIESDGTERAAMLNLRIRCAATIQSLWFMRSEMMAILAATLGEAEARHQLDLAAEDIRDALPSGLRSRPSPLGRD